MRAGSGCAAGSRSRQAGSGQRQRARRRRRRPDGPRGRAVLRKRLVARAEPAPSAPTRSLRSLGQGPTRAARVRSPPRSRASAYAWPIGAPPPAPCALPLPAARLPRPATRGAPAARPHCPGAALRPPTRHSGLEDGRLHGRLAIARMHRRCLGFNQAQPAMDGGHGCRHAAIERRRIGTGRWPFGSAWARGQRPQRPRAQGTLRFAWGCVGAGAGAKRRPHARSASRPLSEGAKRPSWGRRCGLRASDQAFP